MNLKAPVGLAITSYELSNGQSNPVITHIFWGSNLEQAFGYAKSHLASDYFFSSSFVGEMEWKDSVLQLDVDGNILGKYQGNVDEILARLSRTADNVNQQQRQLGIVKAIQMIFKD